MATIQPKPTTDDGQNANGKPTPEEVVDRFVHRLIALARTRLSPKLARRIDPEDIVQSACRSFFRSVHAGRYELRQSNDTWKLLAGITVNKVRRQVEHNTAARRSVLSEESWASDASACFHIEAMARDPSPAEAAALAEETANVMSQLSPQYRKILELRLQGKSIAETASEARCAERTVHRAMGFIRRTLEQRLLECNTSRDGATPPNM